MDQERDNPGLTGPEPESVTEPTAAAQVAPPPLQIETPAPPPAPRPSAIARAARWTARITVIVMFLQLGLWLLIGRNTLIQQAPDMILDDVRSVAALADLPEPRTTLPERVYIISDRLAEAIGEERLYGLESSLGDFNGVLMAEDDGTYVERANQDGCGDCLFVGIRQTMNTPFLGRSYSSYTRPLMFTQMHGIDRRTHEREHLYIWVLGRWVPVRTSWLSS